MERDKEKIGYNLVGDIKVKFQHLGLPMLGIKHKKNLYLFDKIKLIRSSRFDPNIPIIN